MILRITDGVTSVDMSSDAGESMKYAVSKRGWVPQVAVQRRSMLGGYGPYEDVEESISVTVFGNSAAEVLANIATLSSLLDKAERWKKGESTPVVLLQYRPDGGSQLLSTPIIQRSGKSGTVTFPPSFNSSLNVWSVDGVQIQFIRRGQWFGTPEAVTVSPAANPVIQTVTFSTSTSELSPVSVGVGALASGLVSETDPGFLLVAPSTSQLELHTVAADWASGIGAPLTNVDDAGALAVGTKLLRYTPTGTTRYRPAKICSLTMTSGGGNAHRIAIFAAVRNNHASTTFTIDMELYQGGPVVNTPGVVIDASTLEPRMVYLGQVMLVNSPYSYTFGVKASAAAGTLDINYFVFIALDEPHSCVLAFNNLVPPTGAAITFYLAAQDRSLTKPSPSCEFYGTFGGVPYGDATAISWRGVLPLLTKGTTMSVLWMLKRDAYWVLTSDAAAVMDVGTRAVRTLAYLTPQ